MYVSESYSNTEETKARYIFNSVCRDMQRRFHRASDSIFVAPSALPIREVISASMEPSAEMIEPRYVNEDTNSTSAGDKHSVGLSQADPHPNFDCFFA